MVVYRVRNRLRAVEVKIGIADRFRKENFFRLAGDQSCPMQIAISIFDVECEVHDNRRNYVARLLGITGGRLFGRGAANHYEESDDR